MPSHSTRLAVTGGRRRPLAHDEAVTHVETAVRGRRDPGVPEDRGDVLARGVAFGALAGGVVLEDEAGAWKAQMASSPGRSTRRCTGRSVARGRPRTVHYASSLCRETVISSRDSPVILSPPYSAEHARVADTARQAVGVEALEQELRGAAEMPSEVPEARQRDRRVAARIQSSEVARVLVGASRPPRGRRRRRTRRPSDSRNAPARGRRRAPARSPPRRARPRARASVLAAAERRRAPGQVRLAAAALEAEQRQRRPAPTAGGSSSPTGTPGSSGVAAARSRRRSRDAAAASPRATSAANVPVAGRSSAARPSSSSRRSSRPRAASSGHASTGARTAARTIGRRVAALEQLEPIRVDARGGAGSSTRPPPTVVSRAEHDAVAARRDDRRTRGGAAQSARPRGRRARRCSAVP